MVVVSVCSVKCEKFQWAADGINRSTAGRQGYDESLSAHAVQPTATNSSSSNSNQQLHHATVPPLYTPLFNDLPRSILTLLPYRFELGIRIWQGSRALIVFGRSAAALPLSALPVTLASCPLDCSSVRSRLLHLRYGRSQLLSDSRRPHGSVHTCSRLFRPPRLFCPSPTAIRILAALS